jgi:hypothetical protein
MELARTLSEIYHKEYFTDWGYKNFESYIMQELDFSYRKAKYLIEIWDKIKNTDLDLARLEAIGWTKAAEIARIINDDNAELWLERAEKINARELSTQIKQVVDNAIPDSRPRVTYMKFRLDSIDAALINEAITESCRVNNTNDVALAMAQICDEWLLSKGTIPKALTLNDHINYLNKTFSTKLIIAPPSEEGMAEISKTMTDLESVFNLNIPDSDMPTEQKPMEIIESVDNDDDMILSDEDINALLVD